MDDTINSYIFGIISIFRISYHIKFLDVWGIFGSRVCSIYFSSEWPFPDALRSTTPVCLDPFPSDRCLLFSSRIHCTLLATAETGSRLFCGAVAFASLTSYYNVAAASALTSSREGARFSNATAKRPTF